MISKDKYFCNPPESESFMELFLYFWDHGVGHNLSESGLPTPWTETDFESAMMSIKRDVSLRTIQNWRSGKTKPSRQNIHAIALIASGADQNLRKAWAESFFKCHNDNIEKDSKVYTAETEPSTEKQSVKFLDRIQYLIGGLVVVSFAVLFIYSKANLRHENSLSVTITNLKFCDEESFSHQNKRCNHDLTVFPADIEIIYISFETSKVPEGYPFERRWYHNGEQFIKRDGFFDAAWENYTWLHKVGMKGSGDYVLRIIVDGKVTTGKFKLAEINKKGVP